MISHCIETKTQISSYYYYFLTVRQMKAPKQIWDLYINSETTKNQEKRTYVNKKKQLRNSTQILKSCEMKVAWSCPALFNTLDYTVHGILKARILEWVAFPFSRASSQSRD